MAQWPYLFLTFPKRVGSAVTVEFVPVIDFGSAFSAKGKLSEIASFCSYCYNSSGSPFILVFSFFDTKGDEFDRPFDEIHRDSQIHNSQEQSN